MKDDELEFLLEELHWETLWIEDYGGQPIRVQRRRQGWPREGSNDAAIRLRCAVVLSMRLGASVESEP